ncbi:hypothetical protein AB2762_07130 [Acinetobacter indicus]
MSSFMVPKFLPSADGGVGERNPVTCGSIEHKMGIRASATAVLNFDNAVGYLIGEPNKGLHAMFTFMNTARIGTAIQGICHAELAFQGALPYAKERMSMRALSGKKRSGKSGRCHYSPCRCTPYAASTKSHRRRRSCHDLSCCTNCRQDD